MKFLDKLDELNNFFGSGLFDEEEGELFVEVMFDSKDNGTIKLIFRHIDYLDDIELHWDFDRDLLNKNMWKEGHYPEEGLKNMDDLVTYIMDSTKEFVVKQLNKGGVEKLCKKMIKSQQREY